MNMIYADRMNVMRYLNLIWPVSRSGFFLDTIKTERKGTQPEPPAGFLRGVRFLNPEIPSANWVASRTEPNHKG